VPVQRRDYAFVVLQAIGFLLLLDQLTLLLPEVLPAAPGTPGWRYGVFGLAVGRATPLLFADALILVAAYRLEQGRFLRVAGLVHLLIAAALAVLLGLFVLDMLQVRRQVRPEMAGGMLIQGGRAALMAVALAAFAGWAGIRLLSDSGRLRHAKAAERDARFLMAHEAAPVEPGNSP
jgi:hypothetical protein